jgi:hypothetical protein
MTAILWTAIFAPVAIGAFDTRFHHGPVGAQGG